MKRLCLLSSLFFIVVTVSAQMPSNGYFTTHSVIPCPFDTTIDVNWPASWLIYQTLNGEWDGPIDSSRCISTSIESFQMTIDLTQVNPELPIFVRSTSIAGGDAVALTPNYIYHANANFELYPDITAKTGVDCPGGLCTGLIVGIDIPAEDGMGRDLRIYEKAIEDRSSFFYEYCIPTEYFDDSFLKEFIMKITLDNDDVEEQFVQFSGVWFGEDYFWQGPDPLYGFSIPESAIDEGGAYNGNIAEFAFPPSQTGWENFLGMHDTETYPNASNVTYLEATLVENSPQQEVINMTISDWQGLHLQPHTFIRGGLVEGSDSLHHEFNIINNGGNWCITGIVDIVFDGSTNIVYRGGQLDFAGRTSCLMFHGGASLVVGEGHTLHYGSWGNGALGLAKGGVVELEANSHLLMDGRMVLADFGHPDSDINIRLPRNTKLSFGESGTLEKIGYLNGEMMLNVYMDGGELDDTKLSPSERKWINRIYPAAHPVFLENLQLLQNPVGQSIQLLYLSDYALPVSMQLYAMNGQLVGQKQYNVFKGYNTLEYNASLLAAGIYIMRVEAEDKQGYIKLFVK